MIWGRPGARYSEAFSFYVGHSGKPVTLTEGVFCSRAHQLLNAPCDWCHFHSSLLNQILVMIKESVCLGKGEGEGRGRHQQILDECIFLFMKDLLSDAREKHVLNEISKFIQKCFKQKKQLHHSKLKTFICQHFITFYRRFCFL